MSITNYTVSGMTCGHCASHVTEEIQAIAGVEDVTVTVEGGAMSITSATEIPFAQIQEAVAEAGNYSVTKA